MLKILLCDDDPFFLSVESSILNDMIEKEGLDAAISGMVGTAWRLSCVSGSGFW